MRAHTQSIHTISHAYADTDIYTNRNAHSLSLALSRARSGRDWSKGVGNLMLIPQDFFFALSSVYFIILFRFILYAERNWLMGFENSMLILQSISPRATWKSSLRYHKNEHEK